MVKITVNDIEVGNFTEDDAGVAFTWQNKFIDDINKFSIPAIKTGRLLLTKELKRALNNPTELDSKGSVSQKAQWTIKYEIDSIIVQGYLKLIRIVSVNNVDYIDYTFEPKEKDWISQFKDFTLNEVDWSDQDHELNVTNIRASETYSSSRPYVYAPIDIGEITRLPVLWVDIDSTGLVWDYYYLGEQVSTGSFVANTYGFANNSLWRNLESLTDSVDAIWNVRNVFKAKFNAPAAVSAKTYGQHGYLWVEGFNWQVGDFYPCISIKDIVTRCYERIGYNVLIEGTFLDDKYHYWHNVETLNKYEKERNYFKVKASNGGYTLSSYLPSSGNGFVVPFQNVGITGFQDNVNYTSSGNTASAISARTNDSRFTATENTIIRFVWEYSFHLTVVYAYTTFGTSKVPIEYEMELYDSSNSLLKTFRFADRDAVPTTTSGTDNDTYSGVINTPYIYMQTGDYVKFRCTPQNTYSNRAVTSTTVFISESNTLESYMFEGGNFRGKTIRLNEYFPENTAYEWIKDISLIHNLEFYTNEALKTVYITSEDNKRTGKKIDYKKKMNLLKDVEISEVGISHPKVYKFNWDNDPNDWAVEVVETVLGERYAKGDLTNDNIFVTEEKSVETKIYSPSLDKFEINSPVTFNTVEMKGKSTYPSLPTFKRVDYKPRYLKLTFGETLEDNGLPYDGGTASPIYSIEGDGNPLDYVRAEFGTSLHFSSLLDTHYALCTKRINNGWIIRAYMNVNGKDLGQIANILNADTDFRADFQLIFKGVEVEAELLKVVDYTPDGKTDTIFEFVILKDLV